MRGILDRADNMKNGEETAEKDVELKVKAIRYVLDLPVSLVACALVVETVIFIYSERECNLKAKSFSCLSTILL